MISRTILMICFFFAASAGAHAKSINIVGETPRDGVKFEIKESTITDVLQHVSKAYGFKVVGLEHVRDREKMTLTMSGNIEKLVSRLLRNWDYMLVRSPDNHSGITRVMIIKQQKNAASRPNEAKTRGLLSRRPVPRAQHQRSESNINKFRRNASTTEGEGGVFLNK